MIQLFLLASITTGVTTLANLFLKKGVSDIGSFNLSLPQIPKLFVQIITNLWIVIGLVLLGLGFFAWILLLNKTKLNILYPTVVSLQIILISMLSWIFLKEPLSLVQGFGIITIVVGIFLIVAKF